MDKKYNILYVDDELGNIQSFKGIFRFTYSVFTSQSAKEGLELLENNIIHVVITDQRMPDMTGLKFLEEAIKINPECIRIIVTGFNDINVVMDAINKCGIYRYISKPWNVEELKIILKQATELYKLRQSNAHLIEELQQVNSSLENKIAQQLEKITEQHTKQKRSEDKYRLIADNSTDIICLHHIDSTLSFISPSVKDVLGYNAAEIIKTFPIDFFFEPDRIKFKKQLVHFRNNNFKSFTAEYRVKKANGRLIWLEFNISALFSNEKKLKGFQSSSRDVTNRKKAEEKLRKSYQKEKELNDLKSRFVSIASHQFRTPLTSIQTNMDLIYLKLDNEEPAFKDKYSKYLGRMTEEVNRLTDLVNDVLILGKIQNGKVAVSKQFIDLVILGEGLESKYNEIHLHSGRKLIFTVVNKPYLVLLDFKLIHIAISNFINNAFKYSDTKGDPELTIVFKKNLFQIIVKDYGIGIPEDEFDKLFNPFFRATNAENIAGTGLGLTISKEFIELSGGIITIKSQINIGTEVIVTFYK
ncbi:hybrid sensor histidine kinase/response regulator [Flexithrix dorotheae]|uniref:hybrid sensor histidine kinase/response regulator n=1 Tax=Flexithrix dorotheae TaxID=70993 RepID=UPI000363CDBB|nr:ATP-binding protein [Flexithrix dorotheae]